MATRIPQVSFAGGELAPGLHARVDLAKYKSGAKTLLNYFVLPHGGVANRPGMQFITEVANSANKSVLVPFQAASNDTYVLEFSGNGTFRIIRNGALVVYPVGNPSAGQIVVGTHPFAEADLPMVHYEQSNDIVTMTHQNYPPRELRRYDHHDWRWTVLTFAPSMTAPASISGTVTQGNATGNVNEPADYCVTAIDVDGNESLPSASITLNNDLNFRANYNNLSWPAVTGAVKYAVFKGQNGVFGLIGYTPNASYVDRNFGANYGDAPPTTRNPFSGSGNYPRTVAFHQQRRTFGDTLIKPQSVFMSQSGAYANFGVSTPLKDSDAIEFSVAAKSIQKILHMVSVEDLLIFTPTAELRVTGQNDGVITPSSIAVRPQSYYGSSDLVRPLVVGEQIIFVQNKGQIVRDIGYQFQANRYVGNDLTVLARHLFEQRTILGWAYAQAPHSVIWAYNDAGRLIALTYMKEHEVWGWSQHQTQGYIESVTVVSEAQRDVPYFVVLRYINGAWRRYVERMHDRDFADVRDAFFVDCGLSLDNPYLLEAATAGNPAVFSVTAHGFSNGDEVEASAAAPVANGAVLPINSYVVRNVTTNTFTLEDLDGTAISFAGFSVLTFAGVIRKKYQVLAGLGHLEGMQVVGLADGNVVGMDGETLTVTGGSVTLPQKAARAHIGLSYTCDIETLDVEPGQQTAQGILKAVPSSMVRVEKTRGISIGPTFDKLIQHKPRSFEAYNQPSSLVTDDIEVLLAPQWDRHGRICIRQAYPLPATILAHIPKIEYGD